MPKVNPYGGNERQVRGAVELVEEVGGLERIFAGASRQPGYKPGPWLFDRDPSVLRSMQPEVRLALELASHERTERLALAGELEELEQAWREAEEIAAIADGLLVPEEIEEWMGSQRETGGGDRVGTDG